MSMFLQRKDFSLVKKPYILPCRKRSEGRMKEYLSCIDNRAWSIDEGHRCRHLLDIIEKERKCFQNRVIPVSTIIDIALANKKATIDSLKKEINDLKHRLNNCVEEISNLKNPKVLKESDVFLRKPYENNSKRQNDGEYTLITTTDDEEELFQSPSVPRDSDVRKTSSELSNGEPTITDIKDNQTHLSHVPLVESLLLEALSRLWRISYVLHEEKPSSLPVIFDTAKDILLKEVSRFRKELCTCDEKSYDYDMKEKHLKTLLEELSQIVNYDNTLNTCCRHLKVLPLQQSKSEGFHSEQNTENIKNDTDSCSIVTASQKYNSDSQPPLSHNSRGTKNTDLAQKSSSSAGTGQYQEQEVEDKSYINMNPIEKAKTTFNALAMLEDDVRNICKVAGIALVLQTKLENFNNVEAVVNNEIKVDKYSKNIMNTHLESLMEENDELTKQNAEMVEKLMKMDGLLIERENLLKKIDELQCMKENNFNGTNILEMHAVQQERDKYKSDYENLINEMNNLKSLQDEMDSMFKERDNFLCQIMNLRKNLERQEDDLRNMNLQALQRLPESQSIGQIKNTSAVQDVYLLKEQLNGMECCMKKIKDEYDSKIMQITLVLEKEQQENSTLTRTIQLLTEQLQYQDEILCQQNMITAIDPIQQFTSDIQQQFNGLVMALNEEQCKLENLSAICAREKKNSMHLKSLLAYEQQKVVSIQEEDAKTIEELRKQLDGALTVLEQTRLSLLGPSHSANNNYTRLQPVFANCPPSIDCTSAQSNRNPTEFIHHVSQWYHQKHKVAVI